MNTIRTKIANGLSWLGCVIVQCLIKPQPNEARTFKGIAAMTLGGMLLA